jgi:hypothetical protein
MSDRLTLRKGFLDDWWIIERAEHDGREGITDGMYWHSARISDADVEGGASEMLAIAEAIRARGNFSAKRCAVEVDGDRVAFRSPRNSQTDGIVSLAVADALADEILAELGTMADDHHSHEADDE